MRFATFLFKNLLRRKARTLLTVCGVAVAVGTMVALMGISDNFERTTVHSFEARGVDIVVIAAGRPNQLSSDLDESIGDRMLEIEGVKAVAPGLIETISYSTGDIDIPIMVQGWDPESFLLDGLDMRAGRLMRKGETGVAMLGAETARKLKKDVGDKIEVDFKELEVVGIYHSFSHFENGAITVPLPELQELMLREGSVTGFSVIVDDANVSIEEVCRKINTLDLASESGDDLDASGNRLGLSAMPTREYVSTSMHIRMAHGMAWLTSMIALLVGTIGMLNTMVMSVVERVREISILRAIGWRKVRVVRMVLGESMLLSAAGAVAGVLLAVGMTQWLTTLPQASGFVEGSVAPVVLAKGLLMALAVGLVGGTYPAYRATKLLPSEGLRHE